VTIEVYEHYASNYLFRIKKNKKLTKKNPKVPKIRNIYKEASNQKVS